jgi:dTDP-4-amino-4,6-dideoxygalactose transaminase
LTVPFLDLRAQYRDMRSRLDGALERVVEDQRFILGPEVEGLEAEVAAYLGTTHAVGCASGTDALLLTLRALDLEPGTPVIVPAFTFFATAGAVWNAGLRPVFADVDPVTLNLTRDTIEAAYEPGTGAVIVVHLYGRMADDMDAVAELCRARGMALIEDAAQSFGASGPAGGGTVRSGAVGLAGCLSFFPTKILGAFGDAGMVVTDDADLAERVAKLRVHGGRQMYHHEMVGTNSRLDALQAAVLREKLPAVDGWIDRRRAVAAAYADGLAGTSIGLPPIGAGDVFNVFTVRTPDRDAVRARLADEGVATQVYYPVPLHLQPCFASLGYGRGDFPTSEAAAETVLSLPIYPEMPADHVERVVAGLRDAVPAGAGARNGT